MQTTNLEYRNIYVIPLSTVFGLDRDDLYVVYSPLSGEAVLANAAEVMKLDALCASGYEEPYARILTRLSQQTSVVYDVPKSCDDLYQIDILLNYTCNFHCIYCYSAHGRSSKECSFENVIKLVDYLFNDRKVQYTPYIINFSGGGEPLMSFDLLRKVVEYIETKGKNRVKYKLGLVTNGSLITPAIVDFLESHEIDMAVSFEILKDLQDSERGQYDIVSKNIKYMLERNFSFGIRTTFTPASVDRMEEMIEELHLNYPKLKKVVFDTVLAPELFSSPKELESYYNSFLTHYYSAKYLGLIYDIKVESIAADFLSMVRTRTCAGKIVLTPMGTISSCARISSPKETLYNSYLFGDTNGTHMVLDNARLEGIMQQYNIHTTEKCRTCFAKWNCGGGCKLFHDKFNEQYDEVRCNYVRKALIRQLAERIECAHMERTGESIKTTITNYKK